jgi:hypothetical protein
MNYTLAKNLYNVRYFYPREDLEGLLKEIRKFIKDNPIVEIGSVSIDNAYQFTDSGGVSPRWLAYVAYSGTTTEENENA